MCLAICNFKGKNLTETEIHNAWENNSDGAGIMYKHNGELKIYHEMDNVDRFYAKYLEVIANSNCLVHFRVGNKGSKTRANAHPFFVNKNLGFIHNGTVTTMPKDDEMSDTKIFNSTILKSLIVSDKFFYKSPAQLWLLSEATGNSRFAFMDKNEEFFIAGEDKGPSFWCPKSGNWFSNRSHEEVSRYECYGGYKRLKKQYRSPSKSRVKTDSCDVIPFDTESHGGFQDGSEYIPSIPAKGKQKGADPFLQDVLPLEDHDESVVKFNSLVYQAFLTDIIKVLSQVSVELMEMCQVAGTDDLRYYNDIRNAAIMCNGKLTTVHHELYAIRNAYDMWDDSSQSLIDNYILLCL